MDKKELSLITEYHEKILNLEFDENDIYAFLILVRSHSRKFGPLHEISDFVAHREKIKGKIHEYLSKSRKEIIKAAKKQPYRLVIKEVYSEADLLASMNEVFNKYNLKEIDHSTASAIMLCIMSILQDVKLIENNAVISSLHLAFHNGGENISLLCKIPITLPKGEVYFSFAVLRSCYKPLSCPTEDNDASIYKISNDNKKLSVQKLDN